MRKQFQPKAHVPMGSETYKRLMLELFAACETLINRPSVDAYNTMSKMLAQLARAGVYGEGIDLGTDTLSNVCDRYERVHRIGLTEDEAQDLRESIRSIDRALPKVPVNVLQRAIAEVEIYLSTVGA